MNNQEGWVINTDPACQTIQISAKPADGMLMKVKLAP